MKLSKITFLKCPSRCLHYHQAHLHSQEGILYQANYFSDCLLSQFLFSSSSLSHPLSSFCILFPRVLPLLGELPAVDGNTWAQVIGLYPTLVECITCSSSEVSSALKEALGPFKDFMQPPISRVQNGES